MAGENVRKDAWANEGRGIDQIRVNTADARRQTDVYGESLKKLSARFTLMSNLAKAAFSVIQTGFLLIDRMGGKAFVPMLTEGKKVGVMASNTKKGLDVVFSGIRKSFDLMTAGMKKGFDLMVAGIKKGVGILGSSVRKGFENLLEYSDSYAQDIQGLKDALTVVGNQIAAAFAPVIETVIPWLMRFMDVLSAASVYAAQFIAAVGGKNTFIKALPLQSDYNKSMDETTAAAESGTSAKDMFEEVPVDMEVIGWLSSVFTYVTEIKDILKGGFFDGLGDVSGRFGSIGDSVLSVRDNLIRIWSDSAVLSAAEGWVQSVIYTLGSIAGSVAGAGISLAANLLGGIEIYLDENRERIQEHLVSMFRIGERINGLFSDFFGSIAYIFEGFASENGQQLTASLIGMFEDAFMGVAELAGELIGDILSIIIQPFTDNEESFRTALEGFLGVLAEVADTVKQSIDETFGKMKEVYEEHFKPFFDSIAGGLSDTVGKFMEFWNGNVKPLLDEWAAKFSVIWQEHIQPAVNKFAELMGKVADLLKALWENHLKPLIDWVVENVLPVILPVIDGIANAVMIGVGIVGDMIGGVIDIIGGIIDFLTGVFSRDWKKTWDDIVDTFKGIFNHIPAFIESALNHAIDLINDIINGINFITGAIGIPEIPDIPHVKLPRLANGAVIRGGNPFMAVLGDQPYGQTNIEAPLATIEQAVENALSRRGSVGGPNPVISLTVDGQAFARLTLGDILQEMGRQGYNVNVLGVS